MATLEEYIKASELWDEFGNVPMDPETECIEESWHDFPAGTHREDIWHWFEDTYRVPVYDLMFPAQLVDEKCKENPETAINDLAQKQRESLASDVMTGFIRAFDKLYS